MQSSRLTSQARSARTRLDQTDQTVKSTKGPTVPINNTPALKEGPTRHSADILRRGEGPGRVSCIGGATFCHRQNSRTLLKLMQIGKLHDFLFVDCN
ncbi:hypothetical protein PUN28_017707 [Cardiocondyla obscurior]|uniref:Uncharacterized protein n=1 Tax=Cardiocondyla obscurior TaxID=286306 RepID=A0AAW2EMJ6_9HYME